MSTVLQSAVLARAQYMAAGESFDDAVRQLYPVGSLVKVTLGGVRVTLQVSHYSSWDVGTVYGRNVKTSKLRQFSAGFNDAVVLDG